MMRFFGRGTGSSQEPHPETTDVTADHGLSTVQEDERFLGEDVFGRSKGKGSPAYVTNTVLDEPPKDTFKLPMPAVPKDWRNISTPSNSFGSDYDAREAREDGLLGNPSFQTQGAASWSTQYEFPSYQGAVPPPFPLPGLPGDPGLGLGDPSMTKDYPSWMTEDGWPSYDKDAAGTCYQLALLLSYSQRCRHPAWPGFACWRGSPGVYPPMAMPPFPMMPPPIGANPQSLAQYSASLQAIADQYSKQASMVASMAREGEMGLGMPCGGMHPWVLPDPAGGYGLKGGNDRPRTRTDSVQSAQNDPVMKSESEWVTVMIRNLPNNYGRNDVVNLLDQQGFSAKYDFVYLPIDFKNSSGLGYAFVNMVSHEDALEVMSKLGGFKDWNVPSQKVCEVAWGNPEQQGLEFHISRYRNSPVMHTSVNEEFKPLIFQNGMPVPFPEPTKAPRRPRMKKHARIGCRSPEASDQEEAPGA